MRVRGGQISSSIVFDARLFSTSKDEGFLNRQYFIFHELGHVRNGVLRFKNLPEPSPGPAGNKAEYQRENAWGIWEEYYSERSAAETIAGVCQAVAPGIEVGFAATLDHADLVLTYLDGFGTFVRDQVRSFRYGQIDAMELTSSVTNKIRAIVTLLAYVFALEGLNQRISDKVAQIEKHPNYQRSFKTVGRLSLSLAGAARLRHRRGDDAVEGSCTSNREHDPVRLPCATAAVALQSPRGQP